MVKVVGVRFPECGQDILFWTGQAGHPCGNARNRGDRPRCRDGNGHDGAERGFGGGSHPAVEAGHPHCDGGGREDGCEEPGKRRMPSASVSRRLPSYKLDMKLVEAEYTFDNNKLLFYFTADGRIDFRELVKDLAAVFRTRIELRQIGVRDETKIMGGIGICGRALCCNTYLSEFAPVSIKMAKEQNLSLNPTKISGVCGRLMCCLKNEEETYEYLNSRLPGIGDRVTTVDGLKGEVSSVNVLRQMVKVLVEVDDEKNSGNIQWTS